MSAIRIVAGVVLVIATGPGEASDSDLFALATTGKIESLQEWDGAYKSLREKVWNMHAISGTFGRDSRGRTLVQEADELLFDEKVQAELDGLHERALELSAAADEAGLKKIVRQAVPLLEQELYKAMTLMAYWSFQPKLRSHEEALQRVMDRAPEAQRAQVRGTIEPLLKKLSALAAGAPRVSEHDARLVTMHQVHDAQVALIDAYNAERGRLAALVPAQELTADSKPMIRERATPCPEASPKTSGSSEAKVVDVTDLESFYPPHSVRDELEGKVQLELSITAAGCMQRAQVARSSGLLELDEAALRWVETASFLPAERDGQAVDSTTKLRVKFELRGKDTERPPL